MVTARIAELKATMDDLVRAVVLDGDITVGEARTLGDTLARFLDAGPELLDSATPHLRAYYDDTVAEFGVGAVQGIPVSVDIWTHVTVRHPPTLAIGVGPLEPGTSYMSFEGEVSWEPEHGMQLVFEDGDRLCKVGPYDGHHTNAHAYADESLLDVVYVSTTQP